MKRIAASKNATFLGVALAGISQYVLFGGEIWETYCFRTNENPGTAGIPLGTHRRSFDALGGVRQNVVESVDEAVCSDHLLLLDDADWMGLYGRERLLLDLTLRSGIVGVIMFGVALMRFGLKQSRGVWAESNREGRREFVSCSMRL